MATRTGSAVGAVVSALLSLALLVLLAACSDPPDRTAFVQRDSAGIEIVESRTPQWTVEDQWRVIAEPTVHIGLEEGAPAYLFSNVEGALLLSNGRIAVADRGSLQVRYFNRDGVFEEYVGGPGEGPGEFGYIRGIGRCGADSLFVFELDYENVVFSPAGTYIRAARPYDATTIDRRPYTLRCADNGYYVAVGWEPRVSSGTGTPGQGPLIGFYRAEAPAWILAPAHVASGGIATIADAGLVITTELGTFLSSERIGTDRGSRPHPFGRALRFALNRDAIYLGTGEEPQIRQYALTGALERIIRWPAEDVTIGSEDLAAYRTAQLNSVDESRRPSVEQSLRDMPLPPAFPTFVRLETDAGGNLWVQPFRRPTQTDQEWLVFDPRGVFLGRVGIPPNLVVTDIGDDVIVGITRDALGVERIALHGLRKPGSQ